MEKTKGNSNQVVIENILKFLKNPLFLILIFGLIIRIFYFFITKDANTCWWDESLYGNYARYFSGHGHFVELAAVRPVLFSIVWAGFNFITLSEIPIRIFLLVFSMLAIVGMYFIGKEMTNKKSVGYIAALLTASFYIHIFYTQRLLVDTLSFTFFIWSALYFYKYFKEDKAKLFYIASAITAVGFLFRITTALMIGVVLIYAFIIEGFKMFKNKEYYIGTLIFLAIIAPYIIWGFFQFDGFILTQALETNAPTNFFMGGYNVLITYITRFLLLVPNLWAIPVALGFVVGLFMLHGAIVGIDMAKKGDRKLRKDLFLLLMFIIPLIAISFLLDHDEDRYIFNVFPAVFIMTSIAIIHIKGLLSSKYGKIAGNLFVSIMIAFIIVSQLIATDITIRSKIPSYEEIQEASLWMKGTTQPHEVILTHSYPQVQYYSQRYAQFFPKTEVEFDNMDQTNFTYFMVSVFERSPEWVYSYPAKHNLTVANVWVTLDQQPIVVIYNLK